VKISAVCSLVSVAIVVISVLYNHFHSLDVLALNGSSAEASIKTPMNYAAAPDTRKEPFKIRQNMWWVN